MLSLNSLNIYLWSEFIVHHPTKHNTSQTTLYPAIKPDLSQSSSEGLELNISHMLQRKTEGSCEDFCMLWFYSKHSSLVRSRWQSSATVTKKKNKSIDLRVIHHTQFPFPLNQHRLTTPWVSLVTSNIKVTFCSIFFHNTAQPLLEHYLLWSSSPELLKLMSVLKQQNSTDIMFAVRDKNVWH